MTVVPVQGTPRGARSGIARATVLGFSAEALVFPVGLVTAAFLTRTLGASRYGQLSLIYASVSPLAWVASSTFAGRAGVKLIAAAEDWRGTAATLLRANLALGLATAGAFALAAPTVASHLKHPDLLPLLWLASLEIMLAPVIRLHRDALIARGRYVSPALATLAFQVARLSLVLGLVASGWSLGGVIAANLAARALELLTCRYQQPVPLRGTVPGGLGSLREFLGSLFLYALCLQLFNRVDVLMIGLFGVAADTIGYYAAAQNLAQAPGLFAMVFTPLLIAAIQRAEVVGANQEAEDLRLGSAKVSTALWALAGPVAGSAPRLVVLLFGEAFAPAGGVLAWLGIAGGAGLVLSVLSAHEVVAGRHFRPLFAAIPMLLLAVVLQALWIPGHGGGGAARATALAASMAALLAQGFAGIDRLPSRALDLARSLAGGVAGYFASQLGFRAGLPVPIDLLFGCGVTGLALVATGMVTPRQLRRFAAEFSGRSTLNQKTQ